MSRWLHNQADAVSSTYHQCISSKLEVHQPACLPPPTVTRPFSVPCRCPRGSSDSRTLSFFLPPPPWPPPSSNSTLSAVSTCARKAALLSSRPKPSPAAALLAATLRHGYAPPAALLLHPLPPTLLCALRHASSFLLVSLGRRNDCGEWAGSRLPITLIRRAVFHVEGCSKCWQQWR